MLARSHRFLMLCNYSWFAGLQYWAWKTDVNCCGAGDTAYEVQNKPAQDTMRTDFGATGSGGGGDGH